MDYCKQQEMDSLIKDAKDSLSSAYSSVMKFLSESECLEDYKQTYIDDLLDTSKKILELKRKL